MAENDSVADVVKRMLIEILVVEPEDVKPDARFFEDLNGESIEILELQFQLERHYGLKFPLQKLAPTQNIAVDDAGRVTPQAMAALQDRFPFLNCAALGSSPPLNRMTELLTVNAIVRFVEACLAQEVDAAAQPGSAV